MLMFVRSAGDGDGAQKSCKTEVGEAMEDKEEDDNVPAVEVRNTIPSSM